MWEGGDLMSTVEMLHETAPESVSDLPDPQDPAEPTAYGARAGRHAALHDPPSTRTIAQK